MPEQISFVKACQEFFTQEPHGRKLTILELKSLTREDRVELRELLIGEGYDIAELPPPAQA